MQNEHATNITEHPTLHRRKTKITEYEATRALDDFRQQPSTPINLCIDGSAFSWIKNNSNGASSGSTLCREIRVWSEAIGHRTVESLMLCYPFLNWQPYELTEFMYALASHFELPEPEVRCHRVATKLGEINNERIALLKGLGFNRYQIVLGREDLLDLARLESMVDIIRQYSFSVGIQIHDSDCLDDLRDHVRDVQKRISPNYIYIGLRPKLLNREMENPDSIIFDGEEELEDNCIYMGIGGSTRLHNVVLQNFSSPQRYLSALAKGQLPVNPGPLSL